MLDEFQSLYTSKGGYIDPYLAYGGPRYEDILDFIVKSTIRFTEKAPEIFVGFYNNTRLGASAKLNNGKYYIGVSSGSIVIFRKLFAKLLCNPRILPEYGASQIEHTKKVLNPGLLDAYHFLVIPEEEEAMPKDPERQKLVGILTDMALCSLVLHELGHVMNGHLKFISSQTGELGWDETTLDTSSKEQQKGISNLHSQTLEYDADSYAASRLVRMVIEIHKGGNDYYQYLNDDLKLYYSRPEALIELAMFAILASFRLFGRRPSAVEEWMSHSHPMHTARMTIISGTVLEYYLIGPHTRAAHNNDEELLERCRHAIGYAFAYVELGFIDISISQAIDLDNIKYVHNQIEFYNLLKTGWIEIREDLKKYAYEELSGPSRFLTDKGKMV